MGSAAWEASAASARRIRGSFRFMATLYQIPFAPYNRTARERGGRVSPRAESPPVVTVFAANCEMTRAGG